MLKISYMVKIFLLFLIMYSFILIINIDAEEISIEGLNLNLSNSVLTNESMETLLVNITYSLDNGLIERAVKLSNFLIKYKPSEAPLKVNLITIKAKYSEEIKGRAEAFNMLKELKSKLNENNKNEFCKFILEMATTPMKRKTEIEKININPLENKTKECIIENTLDLQWSVNLIWLLKGLNENLFSEGKKSLIEEIDREREFSLDLISQSSPQISLDRANDEAIASAIGWQTGDIVSGKLAHLIDKRLNLTGFSICIGHPITFTKLSNIIKGVMSFSEPQIIEVQTYTEEGYTIYRSIAKSTAILKISVSDLLTKYGADPHTFKPFVPKAPIIEKETEENKESNTEEEGGI